MKVKNIVLALICSISSAFAIADVRLNASEPATVYTALTEKAVQAGLANVNIDSAQTFDVIQQGKKLGTLVNGKGWLRDVHPVCFIGWSTAADPRAFFMQTMGADAWETVDCDKVESVGVISESGDKNLKIAVIYQVDVRGEYSRDYIVLGLKENDKLDYDAEKTVFFQKTDIKDIPEFRRLYQKK
ncbi:hypothetical protein [Erwinia psidii]|uniref:Uncharacterized protein n=1 Tax=Erwinia psidii TaxID=69224 RepID=A0A3N6UVM3_9GAMM|nr:hypothetical protein [Erwinia psidii]MCX8964261.1 hypothetical protein [Erwinia psidii]RQM36905.1 hypothetical protein EB241_18270 [Erwinia psidii]